MKLTKGLRALIESEGGSVCVTRVFDPMNSSCEGWKATVYTCDGDHIVRSDIHPTKRAAIKDLDAVIARMARVFTGAT